VEEREIREAAKKAKAIGKASKKVPEAPLRAKKSTTKSKASAQASKDVRVEVQRRGGGSDQN
jgi:hypothetical protein